jgi:hypothetical protein
MSAPLLLAMPKGQKMVVMMPEKSKSADFERLCIDGSWLEVLQFHTKWRETRVAESEGTFCSSVEAYRPDASFIAALCHGRLDIVKGLMKEGFSLKSIATATSTSGRGRCCQNQKFKAVGFLAYSGMGSQPRRSAFVGRIRDGWR